MVAITELSDEDFISEVARRIISIPAISPESGGSGEKERADEIGRILEEMGYASFERYDVKDHTGHTRSSIVLKVGNRDKTFWIISHIDTVPEGDRSLWHFPPFEATIKDGKIYGRGTGDNGQAIFLSLLLLKNLRKEELKYNLGIIFAADEEMGSRYGIQVLVDRVNIRRDDLVLVPDSGKPDGLEIETAEKSILWLKIQVDGRQFHASRPDEGINTSREGMRFILQLDKFLHENYNRADELFVPPHSTFEPTKHDKNVDNINTIPGRDTFYVDCRILPGYSVDEILEKAREKAREFEHSSRARISIDTVQKEQAPPPTDPDSQIFKSLKNAIRKTRGREPRQVGIGGGTCAKFFRERGIPAVVWLTAEDTVYHEKDEYCVISYITEDRKTLEAILYGAV